MSLIRAIVYKAVLDECFGGSFGALSENTRVARLFVHMRSPIFNDYTVWTSIGFSLAKYIGEFNPDSWDRLGEIYSPEGTISGMITLGNVINFFYSSELSEEFLIRQGIAETGIAIVSTNPRTGDSEFRATAEQWIKLRRRLDTRFAEVDEDWKVGRNGWKKLYRVDAPMRVRDVAQFLSDDVASYANSLGQLVAEG